MLNIAALNWSCLAHIHTTIAHVKNDIVNTLQLLFPKSTHFPLQLSNWRAIQEVDTAVAFLPPSAAATAALFINTHSHQGNLHCQCHVVASSCLHPQTVRAAPGTFSFCSVELWFPFFFLSPSPLLLLPLLSYSYWYPIKGNGNCRQWCSKSSSKSGLVSGRLSLPRPFSFRRTYHELLRRTQMSRSVSARECVCLASGDRKRSYFSRHQFIVFHPLFLKDFFFLLLVVHCWKMHREKASSSFFDSSVAAC